MLLLTYDPARPVRKARRNMASELSRLHEEAALAVARLNAALGVASQRSKNAAGVGNRYVLLSPESANPIPANPTKPLQFKTSGQSATSNVELAQIARRGGMPEAEIARRFGESAAKASKAAPPKHAPGKTLTLADLGL